MNSSNGDTRLEIEAVSTPLIRLLLAMAAEWGEIAGKVETLGNAVSESIASGTGSLAARDIQGFDLVHQRAQGQANLLSRLSRKLAEDQYFDRRRVTELIADIPFQSVRAGLEAAFEGHAQAAARDPDGEEIDWL